MEGLQRWDIVKGPDELRAGMKAVFDLRRELIPGHRAHTDQETTLRLYDVQRLEGETTRYAFLSGRLFGGGEVYAAWGQYDTATKTGDLWLLDVPKPYTPYYFRRGLSPDLGTRQGWRAPA